jgi:hypothetical protein
MTKKQIAQNLILGYEDLISRGKDMKFTTFIILLHQNGAQDGICNFAQVRLNAKIYNMPFVKVHCKCDSNGTDRLTLFWFKIPNNARTKKEAIKLINKRIEILKTWL